MQTTKRDLNYVETPTKHRLALNPDASTPEILKRGITLMLFSPDPEIRNFNGTSVVNSFSTIPQTGFDGISFYLTVAAKRIQTILSEIYPNIDQVFFDVSDEAPSLIVRLNIRTTEDDTLTAVVYE